MAFITLTSPHAHGPARTAWIMQQVILATLPGVFALSWFFGFGTLVNMVWASVCAVGLEAAFMMLRKRPVLFYLKDWSAVLTGVLVAIALPPYTPWWITFIGMCFAIVFAKQLLLLFGSC